NVRELGNMLERALVRCRDSGVLGLEELGLYSVDVDGDVGIAVDIGPAASASAGATAAVRVGQRPWPAHLPIDVAKLERLAIEEALRREGDNRTHAARLLGISLRTLRNKLRLYRSAADPVELAGGQSLPGNGDPRAAAATDIRRWHGPR